MTPLVNYDGGYVRNSLEILFKMYRYEHDDPKERQDLEEYLKSNYPEEYREFKEYEKMVEKRTPNLKQQYFDFLDGKGEMPDFKYFTLE